MESLSGFVVFVQVAETRSFVAAARALGVSASAVGKRIARLEARLNVRLFHRSTRSIALTAEGARFLERCRRVLAEIEEAEQELSRSAHAPSGRLRVSLPALSAPVLPVLADFMAAYPDIQLDLDFTDRLVDVIDEGFDAVVRGGEPRDSRLSARRLGTFAQVVVGSPDYFARRGTPRTPADLAHHTCLLYRFPTTGKLERWPLRPAPGDADVEPPRSMICNNVETRVCFALRGRGLACVPDFAVRDELASARLRTVLDAYIERPQTFHVLWPSGRHASPKLRACAPMRTGAPPGMRPRPRRRAPPPPPPPHIAPHRIASRHAAPMPMPTRPRPPRPPRANPSPNPPSNPFCAAKPPAPRASVAFRHPDVRFRRARRFMGNDAGRHPPLPAPARESPSENSMKTGRRHFVRSVASASAALAAAAWSPARAAIDAPASPATALSLTPGRWSPNNVARLRAVLAGHGASSPRYRPEHRPYAVFDWDNTSIMNDCEEALLMHQIDGLHYRLTPEQFSAILRQGVPDGPFDAKLGYTSVDGKPVRTEDIAADVDADYRWLHANYRGLAGDKPLDEIHRSEPFRDFRAKLYFMYDAICDTYPVEIGYKWIMYWYAGMTRDELQAMAFDSNVANLGDALRKVTYESSRALPGKAGVIAATHFHGIRIHEEIRAVMDTLRSNGIDVYVSTASLDDVVRVFAGHPAFGYGVPAENVIGMRLTMANGKYMNEYLPNWHFNYGPGKTVGIRRELEAKKGYGPLLVFGDSDGDAWMLRDFADTAVGVIVNRMKKGEIGIDSRKAAEQIGAKDARLVLQGRDENTGLMVADERSIKYGKRDPKLLA
ncbi:phosphoserine phosphatase [Burkholderia pseudomallei]|nr:phosphoserine phosphatase [Burkholderia pseudomallei]